MNMFERIADWYNNLEQGTKKTLFFIGVALFLVLLIGFLIWINSNPTQQTPASNNTPAQTQNNITTPLNSFNSGEGIEKVDTDTVGFSAEIGFLSGRRVAFFDKDYKLRINGRTVERSPVFVPVSTYSMGDSLVINEMKRSTVYANNTFSSLDAGIFSLTPMSSFDPQNGIKEQYYFLQHTNEGLTVNVSTTLTLQQGTTKRIGTLIPGIPFQRVEIKDISGVPTILVYEKASGDGVIEMWKVNEKSEVQKIQTITRAVSTVVGYQKMMVTRVADTPSSFSVYEHILISYDSTGQLVFKRLDILEALNNQKVFGTVNADRCAFDSRNSLFCLVKADKVNQYTTDRPDVLVKVDLGRSNLSIVSQNITFTARNVHVAPDGGVYVVTQDTQLLYRFTNTL